MPLVVSVVEQRESRPEKKKDGGNRNIRKHMRTYGDTREKRQTREERERREERKTGATTFKTLPCVPSKTL